MDSDLSLIEIAGEDDSLLRPLPSGEEVSNLNNGGRSVDYFLCSPLQVPRSNSNPLDGTTAVNKERFDMDSANKENFNVEKQETLKLSIEPQQMKRKKKGGGYNLRKSLAWDRAFFTEEGVLDAAELSMITGNFSKSNGQTLSAIHEDSDTNSSDLLTDEEKLFKQLPATTSEKTKKVGGSLLPKKTNEASTSVANRKVLSTHDVNRIGSKRSACPRPVPSSSTLKRPANFITTKASEKVSKVSKFPVQKPSPCAPPSRIGKGSIPSASVSKQSQITRPDNYRNSNTLAVNTQKKIGLKGSSNNTKSVTNISKAGPASKSVSTKTSLGPAKRNVISSVKSSQNTEANKSLEVIPNPLHPSTSYRSIFKDGGSGKIAMTVSQNQKEKPTGLRMPSPSLGFFGQSKAPTFQSPLKMTSQPGNVPESNISNLRKIGMSTPISAQKPPLPPRSVPKVLMEGKTTKDIKASGSSFGSSTFRTLNLASHETVESSPQVNNVPKVENKLESGENSYEAIKGRNRLRGTFGGVDHQDLGRAGQCTAKEISEQEDITLHANVKRFSQKQFDKNDFGTDVVDGSIIGTKRTESENVPHSCSEVDATELFGKSDSDDIKLEKYEPFLSIKHHSVSSQPTSGKPNIEQLHGEQTEVANPLTFETGQTFSNSQILQENVAHASPHLQSTEQGKEDIIAPGKLTLQSNMGEQALDVDIIVKASYSNSSYTVDIQPKVEANDTTEKSKLVEFSESLLAGGHALQDGCTLHVDDCLLTEQSLLPEKAEHENVPLSDEPEGRDTCGSKLKSSSDPCTLPVSLRDGGSEMAKLVEFQNHDESPSASIDSKPGTQSYDLDHQFHVGIHDETTVMELGNMEEHHVADVERAEDVVVTCQNSGQDTSSIISAPSLVVLLEGDASADHTFELADAEDKKLDLPVNSLRRSSDQPEDDFCPDHNDYSIRKICVLGCTDDVNDHQEGQDKHIAHSFGESGGMACEEKQCPVMDCLFFQDTHSLEEPREFKNGNNSGVYLEVSSSGSEDLGLSLYEKMDHVIKKQDENSEFQCLAVRTGEDSTQRVPGVGFGSMSQDNFSVQVFNKESETILESLGDSETEKIDHGFKESEEQSHIIKEQYVDPEILRASFLEVGMNDAIHENIAEAPSEENDVESVFGLGDDCGLEPKMTFTQVTATQDRDLGENKESESLRVDVAATSNLEIQSSVKNLQVSQKQETESRPDLLAEQSEKKKAVIDKKQDRLVIKRPTNAVPFSDEWLEALEAAGEEILTMKSGAVQNSPEDRSQPEPSPWSPVKRKHNQTLGPFDCTKHINH